MEIKNWRNYMYNPYANNNSDVTNELNFAKVFLANTQMSNYDIVYILEEQNIGR